MSQVCSLVSPGASLRGLWMHLLLCPYMLSPCVCVCVLIFACENISHAGLGFTLMTSFYLSFTSLKIPLPTAVSLGDT